MLIEIRKNKYYFDKENLSISNIFQLVIENKNIVYLNSLCLIKKINSTKRIIQFILFFILIYYSWFEIYRYTL